MIVGYFRNPLSRPQLVAVKYIVFSKKEKRRKREEKYKKLTPGNPQMGAPGATKNLERFLLGAGIELGSGGRLVSLITQPQAN